MVGDDGLDGGSFVGVSIAAKVVLGRRLFEEGSQRREMAPKGSLFSQNIFFLLDLKGKINKQGSTTDRSYLTWSKMQTEGWWSKSYRCSI